MAKAKRKKSNKTAPATGMVVKNNLNSGFSHPASVIPKTSFSSSKKGGVKSTPRKAK